MPLPQDVRPVLQDMKDTLVNSDAPWMQSPMASIKVLWVSRESGSWATLFSLEKGTRHILDPLRKRGHWRLSVADLSWRTRA